MAALLVIAGGVVHTASAGTIGPVSGLSASDKAALKQRLLDWGSAGATDDAEAGLFRAAAAGGAEPSLVSIGTVGTIAGTALTIGVGSYVVYRIATAAGVGSYIYRKITGQPYGGSQGNAGSPGWKFFASVSPGSGFSNPSTYTNIYALKTSGNWGPVGCSGSCSGADPAYTEVGAMAVALGASGQVQVGTSTCSPAPASSCFWFYATAAQIARMAKVTPATSTDYSGASTSNRVDASAQYPATSMTDAQLQAALDAINAASQSAQDAIDAAAVAVLRGTMAFSAPNCVGLSLSACQSAFTAAGSTATVSSTTTTFTGADVTNPAGAVISQTPAAGATITSPSATVAVVLNPASADYPFNLPKPYTYETYGDYLTRLQALGYVGTITNTQLDPVNEDGSVGPNAVGRVQVNLGTATSPTTIYRSSWPTTAPRIRRGASVTLFYNPPSAPDVTPDPTEPPPPGGTIPPQTGPACNCPPLDFGPLNVGTSTKFPFGMFAWFTTLFGSFSSTAVAPSWSISKPPGLGTGSWTITAPTNAARTVTDLVMKFITVVGSIWFAGTWLIGWGRGDGLGDG